MEVATHSSCHVSKRPHTEWTLYFSLLIAAVQTKKERFLVGVRLYFKASQLPEVVYQQLMDDRNGENLGELVTSCLTCRHVYGTCRHVYGQCVVDDTQHKHQFKA